MYTNLGGCSPKSYNLLPPHLCETERKFAHDGVASLYPGSRVFVHVQQLVAHVLEIQLVRPVIDVVLRVVVPAEEVDEGVAQVQNPR